MPGCRGRLIANIIYRLINNIDVPMEFTELNSAHVNIDYINLNYTTNPTMLPAKTDKNQVYWTHMYPNSDWSSNFGKVIITADSSSIPEILLNAAIKNIFPKLEKQSKGIALDQVESKFMSVYKRMYGELDPNILIDSIKQQQFLQVVANDGFGHRIAYSEFIDNTEPIGYQIEYKDMFNIENGKYTTLVGLSNYLGIEYNQAIHLEYAEYDRDKFNIFQKYCPWFLQGRENEQIS
jgi:hypothetical protein